ncbi:hypothetical protein PGTUg99_003663 [Puccinia graminis f. sp. tritici]|uniref:Uncharacterized protein n=1 Tax=Puccinia graminis f. sp. tritici TaxID=56615 RepID=A0A5B0S4D8_PUCGR|nr:hypothetical protein PGTUg99_003663 [Puccinia graminis f. sp. tritici]
MQLLSKLVSYNFIESEPADRKCVKEEMKDLVVDEEKNFGTDEALGLWKQWRALHQKVSCSGCKEGYMAQTGGKKQLRLECKACLTKLGATAGGQHLSRLLNQEVSLEDKDPKPKPKTRKVSKVHKYIKQKKDLGDILEEEVSGEAAP